ncbi:redoxin domain-containing protein [Bacteroidales bacterium OttesenSCG-928-M11]|nr:redoxin domain-containing protein [Bacteroidales bacterium OttesenSCG-928-M11]
MNRRIALIICFLSTISVFSQQLSLNFPHFKEKEYSLFIHQGTRTDTIARGYIDKNGYIEVNIPDSYKGYTGIVSWRIQQGGGLDFILTKTDLDIVCTEAIPNGENIQYKGNQENKFLLQYYNKQENLFRKANTIYLTLDAYQNEPESKLKVELKQEYNQLKKQFEELYTKTIKENSYSARYSRIRDFYNRIPLYQMPEVDSNNEARVLDEARRFISEEIDMEVLFTSGFWSSVISYTFEIYPNEKDFGDIMVRLLKRTSDPIVFNQLAEDLVTIVEQFAWEEAEEIIVEYLKESKRIQPKGIMYLAFERAKIQKGGKVPVLIEDGKPITISSPTLLIFYEEGCTNCDIQIRQLTEQYDRIKQKGYDIISVSADTDPEVGESSPSFPWSKNICDYDGLEGINFQNYGIFGTPTILLIDKEGKLEGRYARLEDIEVLF